MTNYEIIEKFESDKVKSSLDIVGGVFVETDLVHEIVKALRSQPCDDTISRQAAIDELDKGAWGVEWNKRAQKTKAAAAKEVRS